MATRTLKSKAPATASIKSQPTPTQAVTFPLPAGSSYWGVSMHKLAANWSRLFPLAVEEVLLSGYTLSVGFVPEPHLICTSDVYEDRHLPFTLLDTADELASPDWCIQEQLDYLGMLARVRATAQTRAAKKRKAAMASLAPWQRDSRRFWL